MIYFNLFVINMFKDKRVAVKWTNLTNHLGWLGLLYQLCSERSWGSNSDNNLDGLIAYCQHLLGIMHLA